MDTSVIGGCEDNEFRDDSRRLFEEFKTGRATLVLSDLTVDELAGAPARVREILDLVPEEHKDLLEQTDESDSLAQAYIEAGAIGSSSRADAVHVALATLCGADLVVSWHFKHMVNWQRIKSYNQVNVDLGHNPIDIRTPKEVVNEE